MESVRLGFESSLLFSVGAACLLFFSVGLILFFALFA
jgi:hypothetical protein